MSDTKSVSKLKKLHIAEEAIRLDIENERHWLTYQAHEQKEMEQSLLAREAGIKEAAIARVASELADQQHAVNCKLSDMLTRSRIIEGENPSASDLAAATEYFGATDDVHRLTFACLDRPSSEAALVYLWKAMTHADAKRVEDEAQANALASLISSQREAEFAANKELEVKMER